MTRSTPPKFGTDTEAAEITQQAQDLFALADKLVARAEHLRESAQKLVTSARIDVRLWSVPRDNSAQQILDLGQRSIPGPRNARRR
jgi:hypothetical protein